MKKTMLRLLLVFFAVYVFISEMMGVVSTKRSLYIGVAIISFLFVFLVRRLFGLPKAITVSVIVFVGILLLSLIIALPLGWESGKALGNGAFTGFFTGSWMFLMPHSPEDKE